MTWPIDDPPTLWELFHHDALRPKALAKSPSVVRPGQLDGRCLVDETVGRRIVCFVAKRPPETPLVEIVAVPPLLSPMCDDLNEFGIAAGETSITRQQVDTQGKGLLERSYERSLEGLHPPVRRFVEDRMVTVLGNRNPVAIEDAIAELVAAGVAKPEESIRQLIDGRLLSTAERGRAARLEITHEVLVPLAVASRTRRREKEELERVRRPLAEQRRVTAEGHQKAAEDRAAELAIAQDALRDSNTRLEKTNRDLEESAAAQAEANARLRSSLYTANFAHVDRWWLSDPNRALTYLYDESRFRIADREFTWGFYHRLCRRNYQTFAGHRGAVNEVAFSPDGKNLASGSGDDTIKLWDIDRDNDAELRAGRLVFYGASAAMDEREAENAKDTKRTIHWFAAVSHLHHVDPRAS